MAAVPLGGYVKMLDEREGEVAPQELGRAFNRQSVWRRYAVVIAGPLANFLFAILLYWPLFMHGVQEARPIVAVPPAHTPAASAGFEAGRNYTRYQRRAGCVLAGRALAHAAARVGAPAG